MRRMIILLTVAALMAMMVAVSASPALAHHTGNSQGNGWKHTGVDQYGDTLATYNGIGYGKLYPKKDRHEY
jgi:hypothetical protein